jgi:hypothetical protein
VRCPLPTWVLHAGNSPLILSTHGKHVARTLGKAHDRLMSVRGRRAVQEGAGMTTRIKIGAAEVRLGDLIYNGLGTSKHPTDTWETITQSVRWMV